MGAALTGAGAIRAHYDRKTCESHIKDKFPHRLRQRSDVNEIRSHSPSNSLQFPLKNTETNTTTMIRPACIWMIALLTWLAADPLQGGPLERARHYLTTAIREYEAGQREEARYHLALARGLDPEGMEQAPDARRLSGLLHLREFRHHAGLRDLAESARLQPDPYLFYLIGSYQLDLRSTRQAASALARAARLAQQERPPLSSDTPTGTLWPLLPSICPGPEEATSAAYWDRLSARKSLPFQHRLTATELALSAYTAWSLQVGETPPGPLSELRQILNTALTQPGTAELSAAGRARLAAPEAAGPRTACLQHLEAAERQRVDRIRRGFPEPDRRHLKTVRRFLKRGYQHAMFVAGDSGSAYRYGGYLLRRSADEEPRLRRIRALEALHALRRAFSQSYHEAAIDTHSEAGPPKREDPGLLLNDRPALERQAQVLR